MKTIFIVLTVVALFYVRSYLVITDTVQADIQAYNQTDKACRGGNPEQDAVQLSCTQRDNLTKKLVDQHMCWGRPSQAEYEKTWVPCGKVAVDILLDKIIER